MTENSRFPGGYLMAFAALLCIESVVAIPRNGVAAEALVPLPWKQGSVGKVCTLPRGRRMTAQTARAFRDPRMQRVPGYLVTFLALPALRNRKQIMIKTAA